VVHSPLASGIDAWGDCCCADDDVDDLERFDVPGALFNIAGRGGTFFGNLVLVGALFSGPKKGL